MFSGFDFGTSNCAMGVMNDNREVQLLPIDQGNAFMPSMLYALDRDLICESVAMMMADTSLKETSLQEASLQKNYMAQRTEQLATARRVRSREDIASGDVSVFVGQEAHEQYLNFPSEGYFVKSIKSFLGSSGLHVKAVELFEDIVTAMMLTIKQRAEQGIGRSIEHTVIGRPVNFQGVDPVESNRRAIDVLTTAAKRVGFRSVEFLYEPLAAGLDFEMGLSDNNTVLVVDVGGGTTDCSMVRMGPRYRDNTVRTHDVLGHSGSRMGGNDFDIQLAGNAFMPLFGLDSELKNGNVIPNQLFWSAVRTNNVAEQATFTSKQTGENLQRYLQESTRPDLLTRMIHLREDKKNHQLVRVAEKTKISLSDKSHCDVDLSFFDDALSCAVTREQFAHAVERQVSTMVKLVSEVINQAQCQPDLVYITGGAAKSQVIRAAIEQRLAGIDIIDGDHFGSVTKGLTVWAQRIFA